MSESELHAILNEIKNKGQVPEDNKTDDKEQYVKIIESFNSVTKEDAVDAFNAKREGKAQESKKESFFSRVKKIFAK